MDTSKPASYLNVDQLIQYKRDGYLIFRSFICEDEVNKLRSAYDEILTGTVETDGDRMLGNLTRQVMQPSNKHPTFSHNTAVEKGRMIASQILGDDVEFVFDMLIYKPPAHPHETPWHQDMAYAGKPYAKAGSRIPLSTIQFWVALDDVDEENGCIHFIPGYHRKPLLRHVVASGDSDDPSRLLSLADVGNQVDLDKAVAARLPAGGATLHSYGTPHYTPPNRSAHRARRAYIFNLSKTS